MDSTVYEMIGGADTLEKLADAFYRRVQAHPTLSQLFPVDIVPVRNKQVRFLTQFFGGPHLYSDVYGPPMLRLKHLPHPITATRAFEWLGCMKEALEELQIEPSVRAFMLERLTMTAHHMVNSEEVP